MKKWILLFLLLLCIGLSAYNIGSPVGNHTWTDSNGQFHSIHDLIDSGKVVVFYWGNSW